MTGAIRVGEVETPAPEAAVIAAQVFRAFKDMGMTAQWVEYSGSTAEYPGRPCARLWLIGAGFVEATEIVLFAETVEDLRAMLPPECVFLQRHPDDKPWVVGTWI